MTHALPFSDDLVDLCRTAIADEAAALARFAGTMGPEIGEALALMSATRQSRSSSRASASRATSRARSPRPSPSIGKPALFVHAAEASHGDLGLVAPRTVALILSNSGETPELSDLIHYCDAHGIPIVALTARADEHAGPPRAGHDLLWRSPRGVPDRPRAHHLDDAADGDRRRARGRAHAAHGHGARRLPPLPPGRQARRPARAGGGGDAHGRATCPWSRPTRRWARWWSR